MAEPWPPAVDFQAYLEAKVAVDSASLNRTLFARFRRALQAGCRAARAPRLLDLGTGTGAMLRRALALLPAGDAELAGLDRDARSLRQAFCGTLLLLRERGWQVRETAQAAGFGMLAVRDGRRLRIRLVRGDLLDPRLPELLPGPAFGFVTAHAFLDLLPLERALGAIRRLLAPGGLLYATLNYDGATRLRPAYPDPGFERALLSAYDRSMEDRLVDGQPTGGAFSGRRLRAELRPVGFRLRGAGRSDWDVRPAAGRHSPGAAFFLQALLDMIASEGLRASGVNPGQLRSWWERRGAELRAGRLRLRVRNLDLLARSPGGLGRTPVLDGGRGGHR